LNLAKLMYEDAPTLNGNDIDTHGIFYGKTKFLMDWTTHCIMCIVRLIKTAKELYQSLDKNTKRQMPEQGNSSWENSMTTKEWIPIL
jgi:hypothetical protein